jgi:hypothetical protein
VFIDRLIIYDLAAKETILERREPEYLHQHGNFTGGVAFSSDGRTIATGHEDGTILFWNVPPVTRVEGEKVKQEAELWDDLTSESPAKAYAAIWRLHQYPEETERLLRKQLPPAKPPSDAEVRAWIGNLDSDQFDEREAASKQLKEAGRGAEDALRRFLKGGPPPEQKRRIQELLVFPELDTKPPKGEGLRAVRAVAVLEGNPTAPARQLLKDWAKGTPGEWLTEEAVRALARLKCTNP